MALSSTPPCRSLLPTVGDTVGYELDGADRDAHPESPAAPERDIVPALIEDLEAALDRAEADDVRAIRLRGAGPRLLRGLWTSVDSERDGGRRRAGARGTRWPTTA